MKEKLQAILHYVNEAKTSLKEIDAVNTYDRSISKDTVLYCLNNATTDIEAAIAEDEEEPTERFEVRKRLLEILGFPASEDLKDNFEKTFAWVIDGKKVDRDGKLFCLKYGKEHSCGNTMYALTIAKEIFDVLL